MPVTDAVLGKLVLTAVIGLFSYFVIWLTILPFTELHKDHWLYKGFLDRSVALLSASLWGLTFIGSLMAFTAYHLCPVL